MKSILFSSYSGNNLTNIALLLFRITLSLFFLTHGLPKLERLIQGNGATFSDPLGIGNNLSLILAVVGEVVAPVLIIFGLMTRLAAIPPIITMFVAAFIVNGGEPFKSMEMALLYLVGFALILLLGPGRYSIDRLINTK